MKGTSPSGSGLRKSRPITRQPDLTHWVGQRAVSSVIWTTLLAIARLRKRSRKRSRPLFDLWGTLGYDGQSVRWSSNRHSLRLALLVILFHLYFSSSSPNNDNEDAKSRLLLLLLLLVELGLCFSFLYPSLCRFASVSCLNQIVWERGIEQTWSLNF